MILRGWLDKEIRGFRGAWTALSQIRKGSPRRAFEARNMEFPVERARSRAGSSARLTVGAKVTALYNWLTSTGNVVVYLEGTVIKMVTVAAGTVTSLFSGISARSITMAEAANRIYLTAFATTGLGATQARVTDGLGANDVAFTPPGVIAFATSEPSAGLCTAGTRLVAYIIESRSGYVGRPGPAPSNVFTPVTHVGTALKTIRMAFTAVTIPSDAAILHPIMTRSDNHSKWYFPNTEGTSIPAGVTPWTFNVDISISDEDLTQRPSADDHFNLLAQLVNGTGPFSPSVVFPYGQRLVWIADQKAYISDIDDVQRISEDLHAKQVQGRKRIITGFPHGGNMYLLGPSWTQEFNDNGDYPRTWAQGREVSGAIGTSAPAGCCWETAGDYVWVPSESGLYLFRGRYDDKPITFLQSDQWKRINWTAAYAIRTVDFIDKQLCLVAVPLDAATEPSHIFAISYQEGLSWERVNFSVWDYDAAAFETGVSTFSAIGMVQESTTARYALWVAPSAAGEILMQDDDLHNDNGAKINSVYETGWMREPGDPGGHLVRFGNLHADIRGSGSAALTAYNQNHTRSVALDAITLSAEPGEQDFRKFDLNEVENFSVKVETNAVGHWFELLMLKPYWKKHLRNR